MFPTMAIFHPILPSNQYTRRALISRSNVLFGLLLLLICRHRCTASDSIASNQSISDGETITSTGGIFRLGFFSPNDSSSNRYVGIWYNLVGKLVVVWVANRQNPVNDSTGVLKFGAGGGLVLADGRNKILWSMDLPVVVNNSVAKLLDTGNLVLIQGDSSSHHITSGVVWNSFDHLTDTLLPAAELSIDLVTKKTRALTSWKSDVDPSPGTFSSGLQQDDDFLQAFVWNGSVPFWRSGPWISEKFIGDADMFPGDFTVNIYEEKYEFRFTHSNMSLFFRLVLDSEGRLSLRYWNDTVKEWQRDWWKPEDKCDFYGTCGEFTMCNSSTSPICTCLTGFVPNSSEDWKKGNWSGGCSRRTELPCKKNSKGNRTEGGDGFLKMEQLKLPEFAKRLYTDNATECSEWCSKNCSCSAYAFVGLQCMVWFEMMDIKAFSNGGEVLYVKLANTELDKVFQNNSSDRENKKRNKKEITTIAVSVTVISICILLILCFLGRILVKRKGEEERRNQPTLTINSKTPILKVAEEFDSTFSCSSAETKGLDFLQFDVGTIMSAADGFNESNKLGEGGFGPVYKGVLPGGLTIAVKRLSKESGQGLQEFKNEVLLISKLQHRNLVRLLGYCINEEEKLLIYEFMPNKSLDLLLFGAMKENILDWSKRFHIIEGIAQGLLYLHRDSRLKIIHRDLKASNILLDADLNPKISDFGTARIFGVDQIIESTRRVVGTCGYMSPEYAMHGQFSEKSDVFSFGVLLLEIVSGNRITICHEDQSLNLLGYAWKFWKEGNALELIDPTLRDSWPHPNAIKCINVALLCVQELAIDRPTISSVVSMLTSDMSNPPLPKEPTFIGRRDLLNSYSSEDDQGRFSMNAFTLTEIESR